MEISQKIIDYSIWYYLKYYPSPKKLEQKLNEKFWPNSENGKKYGWIWKEEIDFILKEKMSSIIQEKEVIESKIRLFINKWKSKTYIKQKLFSRLENRELSNEILEEYFLDWELENIKKELYKLVKKFNIDLENISFDQKSKVIQKLLMKWFRYDDIKEVF